MSLRAVSCDDCTFANRYIGVIAFERARGHAQRLGHRTMVKAGAEGEEEDTVYDYRHAAGLGSGVRLQEGDTGSVD